MYGENLKKSSYLKPYGPESSYLVCSITWWTSTKFVQVMPLEPKMAPPVGHMFYRGLYREKMKKSYCLKPQGLEP